MDLADIDVLLHNDIIPVGEQEGTFDEREFHEANNPTIYGHIGDLVKDSLHDLLVDAIFDEAPAE